MNFAGWLGGIPRTEQERLAAGLESGRIAPGVSAAVLRHAMLPVAWAEPLAELAKSGWTAPLLAEAVRAVMLERARSEAHPPRVVSTQPGVAEPGFVDTGVVLRRLFQQAEREVLLAGFRVTDRATLEHLRRPEARRLDVRLFVDLNPRVDPVGQPCPSPADLTALPGLWWKGFLDQVWPEALESPRCWYSPLTLRADAEGWRSMHIKTVVVDRKEWFVTSANFTQRGRQRNFELGVMLRDDKTAAAIARHFEGMITSGYFVEMPAL